MPQSEPNFILSSDDAPRSVEHLRRQALRLLQQTADADEAFNQKAYAAAHDEPAAAAPAPTRAVMIGVVTMPAVFLVVVMGALALFGKPAATHEDATDVVNVARLEQPNGAPAIGASQIALKRERSRPLAISLGEDMRVEDISLDGDRVALHVQSPMGQEIVIYDFARGEVVAEASIETMNAEDAVDSLAMLTGTPQPVRKVAPAPVVAVTEIAPVATPVEETRAIATPRAPTVKPRGSN